MYIDAYSSKYQKINGFRIIVKKKDKDIEGYLSLQPSTRSTYDIAMRDATIDGLLTSERITEVGPSDILYRANNPTELFIIQSLNEFEFQPKTRNLNAIKQNSYATVKRLQYNDETGEEEYIDVYTDVISFITTENKDEKNFQAGVQDNTIISLQIPKRDIDGNLYIINNADRIVLSNLKKDFTKEIKIESVDEFSVPGVIKIYGAYDIRTGE